jgi:NAD(P) transhydrogenase subunit alpha
VKLCVLKERAPGERRVALAPETIAKLAAKKFGARIEAGCGAEAGFTDAAYREAGAEVAPDAGGALGGCDALVAVQRPPIDLVPSLREGAVVIGVIQPLANADLVRRLAERRATVFALERMPRITRAQAMDVLSSQSNLAGYKAVLIAATSLGRIFPMLMTPAGTLAAAKVLVVGAGVAGLQAIATARRLGAIVTAYDVRPAVKEQVQSLGARFLDIELEEQETEDKGGYARAVSETTLARQAEALHRAALESDVIITTALVPGKPAPRLLHAKTVSEMRPGAVIVDLAAEAGGNCELTQPGSTVVQHGVTIHGPLNVAASVPHHASQMFSRNVASFLGEIIKDPAAGIELENEIARATCIAHAGELRIEL